MSTKAPRTPAQLQRAFNDCAGELATAIKALIRGYLPEELRAKPFSVTIQIDHDGKKSASLTPKKKGGAA
ncbi:MAG TPA: hypothetical protein VII58_00885 [Acidobacteriaceae bacterium]